MKREYLKNKMEDEIIQCKKSLRKKMLEIRRSLSEDIKASESKTIYQNIINSDYYRNSNLIMAYVSLKDEVQTLSLMKTVINDGKKLCIPFVRDRSGIMIAAYIEDLSDLVIGEFGILAPDSNKLRIVDPKKIELILLPGVAFDYAGHRLGMGLGFYDRFLSKAISAKLVALAFSCQIVSDVPSEAHDYVMDYIVTKDCITDCKAGKI